MKFSLLLLLLALTVTAPAEDAAGKIVAHVADTPVHQEELVLHLARHRALVAVHFQQRYGITLEGEAAWKKRIGGEVPSELLDRRAMASCLRDKAIQVLAARHGVGRILPFPGFLEHVATAKHKRLLGPWQFYRYEVDNMRLRLVRTLDPGDAASGSDAKLEAAIRDLLDGGEAAGAEVQDIRFHRADPRMVRLSATYRFRSLPIMAKRSRSNSWLVSADS
jgi:hypothetical protein